MDKAVEVKGFTKNEADFFLGCIKHLEHKTTEMHDNFKRTFPNRSKGEFLSNILVNYVGNVILNANNHNLNHFREGYEGFMEHLNDYVKKITLHLTAIQGNA